MAEIKLDVKDVNLGIKNNKKNTDILENIILELKRKFKKYIDENKLEGLKNDNDMQ